MLPSSAGLPFFALAVAAGRNLRRTRCRIRGVLPCGLQAGQHGLDPRAASLATGPFPDVDPHGSASGRHPANFRLGFKRLPLQAWLASQRLPANGVPDAVRGSLRRRLHRPTASTFLAESLLERSPSMPLPRIALSHDVGSKLEFKGFSCGRQFAPWAVLPYRCRHVRTDSGALAGRPSADLRPWSASGTAHLVAEAVKPRAIRCNSPGFLAALQGLTGRPCRGFRPRSLLALAVPRRPLLEPQGVDRSHCGDSDCAEPLSLLGFLPSCPWPRPRWAACLAHGFTANTERVAASPLFALAGPQHLDRREAGLPRSGLSGRW